MLLRNIISSAIGTMLFLCGLPAVAQSASGYFLSQSSPYEGAYTIKVSQLGLRLDGPHITVIIDPETGSAAMFNRQTKTWCKMSDKGLMGASGYGSKTLVSELRSGGTTTMNGHTCKQWYGQAYDPDTQKPSYVLEIFSTKDLHLPRRVEDDCAEMLGIPKGYGWPLQISHYEHYGKPNQVKKLNLQTLEVRAVTTTANDFSVMPGYQLVKNEATVLTGASDKDVDDLLNAIDEKTPNRPHRQH